jgi:hypothetical protein
MSWQIEIPLIVRTLINDLNDNPTYSDERIQQVVTVAAKYVQLDVTLDNAYDINVSASTITPDPVENKDDIFVSLVCLRSACIIDQSTLRTKAAMEGIRAALGPASLSVGGSLEGIKILLEKGPCQTYFDLTEHWSVGSAVTAQAILSPFVGNKFDPKFLNSHYRFKDFY